jgi:undecaprenyl-diphosphatase
LAPRSWPWHELFGDREQLAIDQSVLLALGNLRTPLLNHVMVDLTALGSTTVVTLFTLIALAVLLTVRDRYGALQIVAASIGAGLLTQLAKNSIERTRPEVIPRLVVVDGYSFPSGHSLASAAMYLTIAIVVCRHMRSWRGRLTFLAITLTLIVLIGGSRMYLGVHYPTDVASGLSLGAGWALLLAGAFSWLARQTNSPVLSTAPEGAVTPDGPEPDEPMDDRP